ncbi:HET-domain-containing protein [Jackrogersella minutella]|nr:HET-domain-containing protein [Jackrogersella minutella]
MRLINVETIELHEIQDPIALGYRYAILSHTWGRDEVSFQDLEAGRGPSKQGYEKITLTCEQAKRDGLQWAWVDTCCIDKLSSAELSEAINSMYQWYKKSAICYAYLSDVDRDEFPYVPPTGYGDKRQISRWFTRSWTLQELIAPWRVRFYDRGWKEIGLSKGKIADIISNVTKIPGALIESRKSISYYSAAQKMSWASYRSSTRPEDQAYSLLGLFDVNMPLLYGEGKKAFMRLQEEILKATDDHSLLCWTVPKHGGRAWTLESVFATSPDDFAASGEIRGSLFDSGFPSAVTNRGLEIHLHLIDRPFGEHSHLYHKNPACCTFDAALNAGEYSPILDDYLNQISIILVKTPLISSRHRQSSNRYARLATPVLGHITLSIGEPFAQMPKTDFTDLIYIHKTLFDWERGRFGVGGVHLQNIPIAKGLFPSSESVGTYYSPGASFPSLRIKSVLYSGLEEEVHDVTIDGVPRNPRAGINWSPIYGCVKFDSVVGRPTQTPECPYFVMFRAESLDYLDVGQTFTILLAWTHEYIHFSFHPRKVQIPDFSSYKDQNEYNWPGRRERTQKESTEFWAKLMDPSGFATGSEVRSMYGEIAKIPMNLGGRRDTYLILEREDFATEDGQTAGNRSHFLVRESEV